MSARARASLHDVAIGTTAEGVLGLDIDLTSARWRLSSKWVAAFLAGARARDTVRSLPLRDAWHMIGACGWATFALMLPPAWISSAAQYAGKLASLWQQGRVRLTSSIAWPRIVRDVVRAVATVLHQNPWRSFVQSVAPFPVFSDACGEGGYGIVLRSPSGWVAIAGTRADPPHINVLELEYALHGWRLTSGSPSTSNIAVAVPIGVDNSAAAHWLASWRSRCPRARRLLLQAYDEAARSLRVPLPFLLPSALQPADAASRLMPHRQPIAYPTRITDRMTASIVARGQLILRHCLPAVPLILPRPSSCRPLSTLL